MLISGALSATKQQELIDQMQSLGIARELMRRAEAEIEQMKERLEWIPESQFKSLLLDSSDFVVQRTS